ncbi:MAG TPA: hypothetical protein DEG69_05695, partial [Flavobacteriaceae bacterium]|nr:hypothetical protein [Flavobacteriaceae bacterium]
MINDPGGGQKINLLIPEIKKIKDDPKAVVLFVDGFDILFLSSLGAVLEKFLSSGKRIIFGAEKSCWPDKSLSAQYPDSPYEYKHLNSGNFIGYASDIHKILKRAEEEGLANIYDDQLYYTHEFLTGKYKDLIWLDYSCEIFQCLAWAYDDVEVSDKKIYNKITKTKPLIAHGNSGKEKFWKLSNYALNDWSNTSPYSAVGINLTKPKIYLSIYFVAQGPTNSWNTFFKNIDRLSYPKELIHLHIQGQIDKLDYIKQPIDINSYSDVTFTDKAKEDGCHIRDNNIEHFLNTDSQYF